MTQRGSSDRRVSAFSYPQPDMCVSVFVHGCVSVTLHECLGEQIREQNAKKWGGLDFEEKQL